MSHEPSVFGAAEARPIGQAPERAGAQAPDEVEKENRRVTPNKAPRGPKLAAEPVGTDPLDEELWGLKSVRSDLAEGTVDEDGNITPLGEELGVRKATAEDGRVGYYQWLQGTSMASPHASSVAALVVS
jgi:subtilisin family serine protease